MGDWVGQPLEDAYNALNERYGEIGYKKLVIAATMIPPALIGAAVAVLEFPVAIAMNMHAAENACARQNEIIENALAKRGGLPYNKFDEELHRL